MVILDRASRKQGRRFVHGMAVALLVLSAGCSEISQGLRIQEARRAAAREDCGSVEALLLDAERASVVSESERASMVLSRGRCLEVAGRVADARVQYRFLIDRFEGEEAGRVAAERLAGMSVEGERSGSTDFGPRDGALSWQDDPAFKGVGYHEPAVRASLDFGATRSLRLCVYKTPSVREESIERALSHVRAELAMYRLDVQYPWTRVRGEELERMLSPVKLEQRLLADLLRAPVEAPCDRVLWFVHASWTSRLVGAMAGVPGVPAARYEASTEAATRTRAFVLDRPASFTKRAFDLLVGPFRSRDYAEQSGRWDLAEITLHEVYHLLGCNHRAYLTQCYRKIQALKRLARARTDDFFPAFTLTGRAVMSRRDHESVTEKARELYGVE